MRHSAYLERLDETIVAIATPPGVGAIGMIRISGPKAILIAQALTGKAEIYFAESHRHHLVILRDGNEILDQAILLVYRKPHSYTGEDVVEFSCHGSPYILKRVVEVAVAHGASVALPGEFTFRAFYYGKLNLIQAEAVADLVAAEHRIAHQLAMQQLRGGISKRLFQLRQQLVHFTALMELELDFSEEDVTFADPNEIQRLLSEIQEEIRTLLNSFHSGNALKEGIPIVILGPPNAGKSTLLNTLLEEERAIVTDIPGTTRDVIEERFILNGILFRLLDTAGLRITDDPVEQIGIQKALSSIQKAEILLIVRDVSSTSREEMESLLQHYAIPVHEKKVIYISNKVDLPTPPHPTLPDEIPISAKHGTGIEKLKATLHQLAQAFQTGNTILTNIRHYECLLRAQDALTRVQEGIASGISNEFLTADLRQALDAIGELTGEITTETILTDIFSHFCIGK